MSDLSTVRNLKQAINVLRAALARKGEGGGTTIITGTGDAPDPAGLAPGTIWIKHEE